MSTTQQVYQMMQDADWSYAKMTGHFQGILNTIEREPEKAKEVFEIMTKITEDLIKQQA